MSTFDHAKSIHTLSAQPIEGVLRSASLQQKVFADRTVMFEPGEGTNRALHLKSGWAMTYKILRSGTRVVTDFLLAGDIISIAATELAQETIYAITDVSCSEFPDLVSESTHYGDGLPRLLYVQMLKRQARMSERLTNIGRRDGLERTGHLLLELAIRSGKSPSPSLDGFECPLRQIDIGDAIGLSVVHVNRVLKEMRLNKLVWFRNGLVEFPDRQRLVDMVGSESDYLQPRARIS